MRRSSMSAGTASNARPAFARSIFRARLCEARISGLGPRQSVMLFGNPVPLPVGIKLQHRGSGLLNRAARDIELRPVEFRAEAPGVGDLVGDRLTIDIFLIAWTGADAEQPVLPDLDQPLRCGMQTHHQRL